MEKDTYSHYQEESRAMNVHHNTQAAKGTATYLETDVITKAILCLLESANMQPGDAIDIDMAEYELGLKGISDKDFKRGFAQLMNLGVIDYKGSRLCLTRHCFRGLRQGQEGGN